MLISSVNASGYSIAEAIITSRECEELLDFLTALSSAHGRAGIRNLMSCAPIRSLAFDPRLIELAAKLSGRNLIPYKATLFNKTPKANWLVAWHQDTALPIETWLGEAGWSAPSRKAGRLFAQAPASVLERILALRIHLDESTPSNGPLRVIPGSHVYGVLNDDRMTELVAAERQVECFVGQGGVIAMRPLLLHASSKMHSKTPRRVLHMEYAESLNTPGGTRIAIA